MSAKVTMSGWAPASTRPCKVRLPSSPQVNRATRPGSLWPSAWRAAARVVLSGEMATEVMSPYWKASSSASTRAFTSMSVPGSSSTWTPAVRPERGMAASLPLWPLMA